MKRLFPIPFVFGTVVLSACVGSQELTLIEREQRRLRNENIRLLKENTAARAEVDGVRSHLADTRATLQEVQRDLSSLKEKLKEVRYQMDRRVGRSARQGDQRITDLEARIARIDDELRAQGTLLKTRGRETQVLREAVLQATQGKGETTTLGKAGRVIEPSPVKSGLQEESGKERIDYQKARSLLERKDYRGAIARFNKFLKKHPKSDYADNAQYWIAESYYALRQFDQAILEFDAVRRKYPKGDKVAAALLKQGFAFAELGDKVDARLILQELIARYPESQEALKAKEKVKALES